MKEQGLISTAKALTADDKGVLAMDEVFIESVAIGPHAAVITALSWKKESSMRVSIPPYTNIKNNHFRAPFHTKGIFHFDLEKIPT